MRMSLTMTTRGYKTIRAELLDALLFDAEKVDVGQWHSLDVSGKPELASHALAHVNFSIRVPSSKDNLQNSIQPNLPWADDHFQERVSGEPLNPPPSS